MAVLGKPSQTVETAAGELLPHREIESIEGRRGSPESQRRQRRRVVPAADQRRDHSSQKPHRRVLVELLGKIKSRRNPEALEGGAQRGKIHIGISNYDPDLTKFAARAHSSQDTPRDLLGLAVDGCRGKPPPPPPPPPAPHPPPPHPPPP